MQLASIITAVTKGLLSNSGAKTVFKELWATGRQHFDDLVTAFAALERVIQEKNLGLMSDTGELEKIIDEVLAANAKNVEEVKAGNAKAMNALVGQAMKATKGKANPAQVNELLKKKLG